MTENWGETMYEKDITHTVTKIIIDIHIHLGQIHETSFLH